MPEPQRILQETGTQNQVQVRVLQVFSLHSYGQEEAGDEASTEDKTRQSDITC